MGMKQETYIGESPASTRGILTLRSPIQKGRVSSWNDLEKLWNHIFTNELRVRSHEQSVLLTQDFNENNQTEQERMVQIMFETFGIRDCYILNKGVAALCASQKDSGFVLDLGTNASFLLPVYSSSLLRHAAVETSLYTGNAMSEYLMHHLNKGEHDFQFDFEVASMIREKMSYVAPEYASEYHRLVMTRENCGTWELPSSRYITLASERIQCSELLFDPSAMYQNINQSVGNIESSVSLPETINNSLNRIDQDLRSRFLRCVILNGAVGSYLPGLGERLEKELSFLPGKPKVRVEGGISIQSYTEQEDPSVIFSPNTATSNKTWIGCSTWASLRRFPDMCISKDIYNEYGPPIVHRICF